MSALYESNQIVYDLNKLFLTTSFIFERITNLYPLIMLKAKFSVIIAFLIITNILKSCSKPQNPFIINTEEDTISNTATDTIKFSEFAMGVDLSYVNQIQDHGGIYKENNTDKDPFVIFKGKGANCVRLRLWHNPQWVQNQVYDISSPLYSGLEDVAKSIKRAKDAGMTVNLDLHYSDTWADPGNQKVPDAWKNITSLDVLCDSVYNYTYGVLNSLKSRNLLPEMIQIGNETNPGMMITNNLPDFPILNSNSKGWANLGKVINAGIKAVRDIDNLSGKKTIIALHVADPKNLDWWFTGITQSGGVTDFDVMGFSYYHIWHTSVAFNDLGTLVTSMKNKFKKEIMVLETAYPFTSLNNDSYSNIYGNQAALNGYPYSIQGQKKFLIDLNQRMISAGAKGVFYWEPAWISSNMKDLWGTGSAWENNAFFDYTGNLTDGINYLNYKYQRK